MADIAELARIDYRASFAQALAERQREPLIVPYSIFGPLIVPALWLAIPHTKRPWLYQTRWLVVAYVIYFDVNLVLYTSSGNVACAYASGLMAAWGIISTLHLLVWTRPQFDAARVIKVTQAVTKSQTNGAAKSENGVVNGNGLRHRKAANGTSATNQDQNGLQEQEQWVWQPYPEDAPFSTRLNWAYDLTTSFRCIGWNWSITSVPLPVIPDVIRAGDPVSLENMPLVSRSGYKRNLNSSEFFWTRVRTIALVYLLLDFLATFMVKDPFFIFGPDHEKYFLPPHLERLAPWQLLFFRQLLSLAGMYGAINYIFTAYDLFQYYVLSYFFPIRGYLWQYTNIFGHFSTIFDRGLAAFWGSWWHQTFRLQFIGPATYLVRKGYLPKRGLSTNIVALLVSFLQSAFLHGSGSASTMPHTKIWRSPVFFILQAVGTILQVVLLSAIKKYFPGIPRGVYQMIVFLSTVAWLQVSSTFFVNDIASTGLWLLEPVPISPLRWMGFGLPTDHWWRWSREIFPTWYNADKWWKSGIAM